MIDRRDEVSDFLPAERRPHGTGDGRACL